MNPMAVRAIHLTEWQVYPPANEPPLSGVSMDQSAEVQALTAQLSRTQVLEVLQLHNGLRFKATSFVGRVNLGNLEITISPKIQGAPLLRLLRYAYGLRDFDIFPPSDFQTSIAGFQELLIFQLALEAQELISRGLHRQYQRRETDLASLKGRINVQAVVKRSQMARVSLPCVHYPRLEDVLLNQVLLAGLHLGSRLTSDTMLRTKLGRTAAQINTDISPLRLTRETFRHIRRQQSRLTRAYIPSLTLIELLFQQSGIELDTEQDDLRLPGFLFDMNRFFQALLSRLLREHLIGFELRDEYRLQEMMKYAPGYNPRNRQAPTPRPDYVAMKAGKIQAIMDAKYRDLWERQLPREMLYQLAMYALGQERGMTATILYPTLNATAREARIAIRDPLVGDSRAQVALRPVDLNRLDVILQQMANREEREQFTSRLAFGDTKVV